MVLFPATKVLKKNDIYNFIGKKNKKPIDFMDFTLVS
jgi:hypothetical protein